VYCEIYPFDMSEADIRAFNPRGIILAGGPESVTELSSPRAPQCVFDIGVPVFGICYGMQTMAEQLGGQVEASNIREFGYAQVKLHGNTDLFRDIRDHLDHEDGAGLIDVWMSHGDKVIRMPEGFELIASTPSCAIAAMSCEARQCRGGRVPPAVTRALPGRRSRGRLGLGTAGWRGLWTRASITEVAISTGRRQVGKRKVLLGRSGGVD